MFHANVEPNLAGYYLLLLFISIATQNSKSCKYLLITVEKPKLAVLILEIKKKSPENYKFFGFF